MPKSAFFRSLRDPYQAEIDDLSLDSEGRDVLQRRLAEKRRQIKFLYQMMRSCPEMVAVVFHHGFDFSEPQVLEQLLTLEADELPDWSALQDAVELKPWASALAQGVLAQAQGSWFMVVAAVLEYLYQRPHQSELSQLHDESASAQAVPADRMRHPDHGHDFDPDDELNHQTDQDDSSSDWLADQGFDRKE